MFDMKHALAAGLAAVAFAGTASAAPIFTEVNSPGSGGGTSPGDPGELEYALDVSASDLLHGLVGVPAGTWDGGGAAWLNNGQHGDSFDNIGNPAVSQMAWPQIGASVVFTLGTGANGLGYDITSIQTIAAWQSAGFGNQSYTLEVQQVGGSFSVLYSRTYTPLGGGAGATKISVADDGSGPGGILATGIEAIRFTADSVPGTAGNRATYRELDVFGTDTVPEPSSLALLGLGGLLIARRRRG